MKKYVAVGIVIGLVVALGIGLGAGAVFAQGPMPGTPTMDQMKQMHESTHGGGTWDAMVPQMEQAFGKDWFNQMHGPNGMMNGQNPMGAGTAGSMMNGANSQNHMGNGGMMGGWTTPPATK